MFYCHNCQKKWKWPVTDSHSIGRCQICTKPGNCYWSPIQDLHDPIGILLPEEIENDA